MIVFFSFGSGNTRLNLLGLGILIISLFLQGPVFEFNSGVAPGPSRRPSASATPATVAPFAAVPAIIHFVFAALGVFSIAQFARWVQRNGGLSFLSRLLANGHLPGGQAAAARRGSPPAAQRPNLSTIAGVLQKLPTEEWRSDAELERCSVRELRALLARRGVDSSDCVEKPELLHRLREHGGSSATACTVCCEDYSSGDVVRVLPCGHSYHVECIDAWFYKSTDYSRPPACPLCNAELIKQPAVAPAASTTSSAS